MYDSRDGNFVYVMILDADGKEISKQANATPLVHGLFSYITSGRTEETMLDSMLRELKEL